MPLQKIHINQQRGTWIANPASKTACLKLGHSEVPVMRDFDNGEFTWGYAPVRFFVDFETSNDPLHPAWWMKDAHAHWRHLLQCGIPLLVRKGTGDETGVTNNSVGRKLGIFRTASVEIHPEFMSLELTEKLFECA